MRQLSSCSPAWAIEEGCLVGFDLSHTVVASLRGLDTMASPDSRLDDVSQRLSAALCEGSENAIVRFYSGASPSTGTVLSRFGKAVRAGSSGSTNAFLAELAGDKIAQCRDELAPLTRQLWCAVSTPPLAPFGLRQTNLLGRRIAKLRARAADLRASTLADARRTLERLLRGLRDAGVAGEPVASNQALFELLWSSANPITAGSREAPAYRPDFSVRSQLFASGLENHLDTFVREGALQRVVTLRLPPRWVQPSLLLELQTLPFQHRLVVTLRRLADAEAEKRASMVRRQGHEWNRVLAKFRGADRNDAMPDHHVLAQQHDADDVLSRLTAGERLFEVAIQLWFCAPDEEELATRTELAMARIRRVGQAEGAIEELRGRFAFLSMLPGHHALIGERFHPILASRAADLLPVFQAVTGPDKPVALLTTRHAELVGFHPFDPTLPAWNATVAGGTGSGKSFATRLLLAGWLASEGRVIVVTRGKDYQRFCRLFGGAYHEVSQDNDALCLNPLPARSDSVERHTLAHLANIIGVMVSEEGRVLKRAERRLVYSALVEQLASCGEESSRDAGAQTLEGWVGKLRASSSQAPDGLAERLCEQMDYWLQGPFGPAFLRASRAGDAALSVWDLEPVADPEMQGVVLAVLSGVIAQSIRLGPTVIVMDEVWSLLKSDAGATLVETLYRTVRKQGSSIWAISQSMNDYAALPEGCRSAILNNSPMKFFLAHDGSEIGPVAETFQLNERERALLAGLRSSPGHYSEMLAFFGSRRQLLQMMPTGREYWLATSHPRDCAWEAMTRAANPEANDYELLTQLATTVPNGALHVDARAA